MLKNAIKTNYWGVSLQNLDPKMAAPAFRRRSKKNSAESVWGKIFVPFEEYIPPIVAATIDDIGG